MGTQRLEPRERERDSGLVRRRRRRGGGRARPDACAASPPWACSPPARVSKLYNRSLGVRYTTGSRLVSCGRVVFRLPGSPSRIASVWWAQQPKASSAACRNQNKQAHSPLRMRGTPGASCARDGGARPSPRATRWLRALLCLSVCVCERTSCNVCAGLALSEGECTSLRES